VSAGGMMSASGAPGGGGIAAPSLHPIALRASTGAHS
jgi:hypothetical protein